MWLDVGVDELDSKFLNGGNSKIKDYLSLIDEAESSEDEYSDDGIDINNLLPGNIRQFSHEGEDTSRTKNSK